MTVDARENFQGRQHHAAVHVDPSKLRDEPDAITIDQEPAEDRTWTALRAVIDRHDDEISELRARVDAAEKARSR